MTADDAALYDERDDALLRAERAEIERDEAVAELAELRKYVAGVKNAHTARQADAWQRGYTSGHSNAMRQMSDEPNAPTTPNPYRRAEPETTP